APEPAPAPRRTNRRALAWGAGVLALVAAAIALVLIVSPLLGSSDPAGSQADQPPADTAAPKSAPSKTPTPTPSPSASASPTPTGAVMPAGIIGSDRRTAEQALRAQGHRVEQAGVDSTQPRDSVLGTWPAPGQPLAPGQPVVLLVSTGHPPHDQIPFRVPSDLIGANADDVSGQLDDQGIKVDTVTVDDTAQRGTVIGSYPQPGAVVQSSDLVLVVASGGPGGGHGRGHDH
ncbi:MAG: PASTA domain-containing protein, partial [Microlunatus sp.]|nr:PASTA domain-containing protein [Microlunatus sp.]